MNWNTRSKHCHYRELKWFHDYIWEIVFCFHLKVYFIMQSSLSLADQMSGGIKKTSRDIFSVTFSRP